MNNSSCLKSLLNISMHYQLYDTTFCFRFYYFSLGNMKFFHGSKNENQAKCLEHEYYYRIRVSDINY